FATGTSAGMLGGDLAPVMAVTVSLRTSGDTQKALDAIWRAARNASSRISDDDDFYKEFAAGQKARLVMGFESLPARTVQFGDWAHFIPDGGYFGGELARMDKVSGGRLKSFLKSALD